MKLATICYIKKDNKVLMLKRDKKKNDIHKGFYLAPGGKFEMNETPEECAIREVFEETGLVVKNPNYRGFLTFEDSENTPFGDLWYVWIYTFDGYEGEMIECNEGTLEWVDIDKLTELNMLDGDRIFTPYIFQDKIFSMKFKYDNYKLIDHSLQYI